MQTTTWIIVVLGLYSTTLTIVVSWTLARPIVDSIVCICSCLVRLWHSLGRKWNRDAKHVPLVIDSV